MNTLTQYGTGVLSDISQRYGVSQDAVRCLMDAVSSGGGTQAQFSHPELGGMGQWSSGGMTMVGDMFNVGLQGLVSNICGALSNAYFNGSFYTPPPRSFSGQQDGTSLQVSGGSFGSWWPNDLGSPSSSGSQNNLSYAIFPASHRLAINLNGAMTVYDTGEHMIGGVGQQQSGDASWTFTSQFGTVYLNQLPIVFGAGQQDEPSMQAPIENTPFEPAPMPATEAHYETSASALIDAGGVIDAIEKLGALHDMGILNDGEFQAKKAELLARL
jgi:hypothetical protein